MVLGSPAKKVRAARPNAHMTPDSAATPSPPLLAVIQMLLSAQGLDDVRATAAHGAYLISRYQTLSLYELQEGGLTHLTYRCGDALGPSGQAVEQLLCATAHARGGAASTLEVFLDPAERVAVAEFTRREALCVVRPLRAYGELCGFMAFHYNGRIALRGEEFNALRQFTDYAAISISIARTRTELRNFAYSDPLTGLANRRWLEAEFARLQGSQVSVLLIDFDGLKNVNDTLGFDRGDALIHAVGAALASDARPGESVIRYGGDEFVVIMPGSGRAEAIRRVEELTIVLDGLTLADDLAAVFHGASVGSATAGTDDDLWEALRRATTEMRSRKRRRYTDRVYREYPSGPHEAWGADRSGF